MKMKENVSEQNHIMLYNNNAKEYNWNEFKADSVIEELFSFLRHESGYYSEDLAVHVDEIIEELFSFLEMDEMEKETVPSSEVVEAIVDELFTFLDDDIETKMDNLNISQSSAYESMLDLNDTMYFSSIMDSKHSESFDSHFDTYSEASDSLSESSQYIKLPYRKSKRKNGQTPSKRRCVLSKAVGNLNLTSNTELHSKSLTEYSSETESKDNCDFKGAVHSTPKKLDVTPVKHSVNDGRNSTGYMNAFRSLFNPVQITNNIMGVSNKANRNLSYKQIESLKLHF